MTARWDRPHQYSQGGKKPIVHSRTWFPREWTFVGKVAFVLIALGAIAFLVACFRSPGCGW